MILHTALHVTVGYSLSMSYGEMTTGTIENDVHTKIGLKTELKNELQSFKDKWYTTILIISILLMILAIWGASLITYKILETFEQDKKIIAESKVLVQSMENCEMETKNEQEYSSFSSSSYSSSNPSPLP